MNILRIRFEELYRRHLCRHGQFGINVLHLMAVYGIYFSVFSLAAILLQYLPTQPGPTFVTATLAALSVPYLLLLLCNVPLPAFLATLAATTALIWTARAGSELFVAVHLLLIVFWHRFQLWSHTRYTLRRDMTEFTATYRKGVTLSVLLAVYELPLLHHYFIAGQTPLSGADPEPHQATVGRTD